MNNGEFFFLALPALLNIFHMKISFFNASCVLVFLNLFLLLNHVYGEEANPQNYLEKLEILKGRDDVDSIKIVAQEIIHAPEYQDSSYVLAKAWFYMSYYYQAQNRVDYVNNCYLTAASFFQQNRDSILEAEMYIRCAYNLKFANEVDEAIPYYNKGIELLDVTNSPFWYGLANDHVGFLHFSRGDYYLALKHYQNGVNAFLSLNDLQNAGVQYNKMALVYRKTGDVVKEEEAYLKALGYLEQIDPVVYLGEVYNNYSELLIDKGETEKGLSILEDARTVYETVGYPLGMCSYYLVQAYYYSQKHPVDYEKIIEYAALGLPIAEEYRNWRLFSDFSAYLGEAYYYTERVTKAEKTLLTAIDIAKENHLLPELEKNARILALIYQENAVPEKALKYLTLAVDIRDSLRNEEKLKEFTELDLTFKYRQEQLKDSLNQQREMQAIQEEHKQETRKQQIVLIIALFVLVIIILISSFLFHNNRRNRAQARILAVKNDIIQNALDEKEILLKEIHHRVKNNLQLVSSLLELQNKEVVDEKALESLREGKERVRSMALIHQKLYQNQDLRTMDFSEYTTQLVHELSKSSGASDRIDFEVCINDCYFDVDTAVPLGLILNELITNAIKYAFPDNRKGKIEVKIEKHDETYFQLYVKDNGIGIKEEIDLKKTKSLGLRLVYSLVRQLQGKLEVHNSAGCEYRILFKDSMQRKQMD